MKRTLALFLCFCMLFTLLPLSRAEAAGEKWSFRYGNEFISEISVAIYDAGAGEYTLLEGAEIDETTYEPIPCFTVPEEMTGDYWVYTSLMTREEIFSGAGPYYAVVQVSGMMFSGANQVIVHALTETEMQDGLTLTDAMFTSLAQAEFILEGYSAELQLYWQADETAADVVDLTECLMMQSYSLEITPGYLTAACVYNDYSGNTPAVMVYEQAQVSSYKSFDLSGSSSAGKSLLTAAAPTGAEVEDLSISLSDRVSIHAPGDRVYLKPGVYDVSAVLYSGNIFSGNCDMWAFLTENVDLRAGDAGIVYGDLNDIGSFTRSVKVYGDAAMTSLRNTYPSAGETVYVLYEIRDPNGNLLAAIGTMGAMDMNTGEAEISMARPTVTAGGSAVSLLSPAEEFCVFRFQASSPQAEHTVTLNPSLNQHTVNVSDTFSLNNGSALDEVPPNAPGSLAVTPDWAGDTAVFTYAAATHPNPGASVTAYRLYACSAAGEVQGTALAEGSGLSLSLSSLSAAVGEETAYFTVRAFDGARESASSNVVSIAPADLGTLSFAAEGAVLGTDSLTLGTGNAGALTVTLSITVPATDPVAYMSYQKIDGTAGEVSGAMSAASGGYAAALAIPADAAAISGFRAEYKNAGGRDRSVSLTAQRSIYADTLTVTLLGAAGHRGRIVSAALEQGVLKAELRSKSDLLVSGEDLVLVLRNVPRMLYRQGAILTFTTDTRTKSLRDLPAIENDAFTVSAAEGEELFGRMITIALEVDGSAMGSTAYRLTADVDVYAGSGILQSYAFPGITGSRTLEFLVEGSFTGIQLSFRESNDLQITWDETMHPGSFTCPVLVEPYTVQMGSPIALTMDGEPFAAATSIELLESGGMRYVRSFYPGSSLLDLSGIPDGTYTLSPYYDSCVEYAPVTVTVSGGAIRGETPALDLYSMVYFSVAVKNTLGDSAEEYTSEYDIWYRPKSAEEWLSCPGTVAYSTDAFSRLDARYSGNLFIGPFRWLDVKAEDGSLDMAEFRIVPKGEVRSVYYYDTYVHTEGMVNTAAAVEAFFPEKRVSATLDTEASFTANHEELLGTPRYDVYLKNPLTFNGSTYPGHKIRVYSAGATDGPVQLNMFTIGLDAQGEPNGIRYARTFTLAKFNEAAYQTADDSATLYAPGNYATLYYTGAHDAGRENSFLLNKGQQVRADDFVLLWGVGGTGGEIVHSYTLPEGAETADDFAASFAADSAQVTGSDLAGFLYTFQGDSSLSGQTLMFTPEGGWAAASGAADLRASVTVDGAAAEAAVALSDGKLTVTLPALSAGQRIQGTVRLGYTAVSVPADGQLAVSAKLGEEVRWAYCRRISFTHNLPDTVNAASIEASGRGNYPGEKAYIAWYAEGTLCGAYELSKYGYWGGGFGEYRNIALPLGEQEVQRSFTLTAYRIAAASLAALPAAEEGLGTALDTVTLTYKRVARDIQPRSYTLRYVDEADGKVQEYSFADPKSFRNVTFSFGQTYTQDIMELIIEFDGNVSADISDPEVVVNMGAYTYTFQTDLDKADSTGTRYSVSWSAACHGPMTVKYQQRPSLYSDTLTRPGAVTVSLGSSLEAVDMARLRAAYQELLADPDRTVTAGGTRSFSNEDEGLSMDVTVRSRVSAIDASALQAELDALNTADPYASWVDLRDQNSDLAYLYILPVVSFPGDEGNGSDETHDHYTVGYTLVAVYRGSAFEEPQSGGSGSGSRAMPLKLRTGRLSPVSPALRLDPGEGQQPSTGQTMLVTANEYVGNINTKVGYFGMLEYTGEMNGVRKEMLDTIPFQGDGKLNAGAKILGAAGTVLGVAEKLTNVSDITKEQQEVIQGRINDINGMYAFAAAKCKCDENADLRAWELQRIRDKYLQMLKVMNAELEAEEAACDVISSTKDVGLMVAGDAVNPFVALAIDKGVDAGIESYRAGKSIDRYDSQDDIVVKCGDELDAKAATCNKDGCDVGELKRKPPKLVDPDPNGGGGSFGSGWVFVLEPKIIVDPSGIVYEGCLSNPLSGVECVIYESDDGTETGTFLEWLDAPGFNGQLSHQTTGDSGYYEWYVPAGMWKVTYAKEGYVPAESQVMQVAPQWLDVNQNLLALENTPALTLTSGEGKVYLSFSKPVVLEDVLNGGLSVKIGGAVAQGTWTVLRGSEGSIYGDGVENPATGTGMLVSELEFAPALPAYTGQAVAVEPQEAGVRSYGGTSLGEGAVTCVISGGLEFVYDYTETYEEEEENSGSAEESLYLTAEAGEASALDGAVRLRWEDGTVSDETKVTVTMAEDEAGEALSPVYGVRFAVQPSDTVEVRFKLDEAAAEAEDPLFLGLWVRPDGEEEWQFAGGAYDPETNSLTLLTRVSGEYKAEYGTVSFSDVEEDHWAKEYIEILASRRIMEGYGGEARPDDNITRAEVAALAVRVLRFGSLLGRTPEVKDNFLDVQPEDWFWYEVNLAAKRGIFRGADGYMRPRDLITREELAAVVARMAADAQTLAQEKRSSFPDADSIADWAQTCVAILEEMGFVEGNDLGEFNASGHATRGECAKLMVKLMELYGMLFYDEEAVDPPCLTCPYSR